jgi:branched-chain amino acid aminotransferase
MYYHVDGEVVPDEEATVSVRDRGFMYGDAAFETLRIYNGVPFAWDAHRERLHRTAETLGFGDAVPDDLRARIDETLSANDLSEAYCKVSVSRGVQPGKLTPSASVDPTVVIICAPLSRGGRDGEPVWDCPATVQTVRTRRVPDESISSNIKSHNYLNGIMGRLELRRAAGDGEPADECLLRDIDGNVAEGATSNLFFVTANGLRTPSDDLDLLPGVTRDVVLELAREEDIPVETGHYSLDALRDADEAFLTNSTWELRPIESVDGIDIGSGPITKLLARLYDARVETRHYSD